MMQNAEIPAIGRDAWQKLCETVQLPATWEKQVNDSWIQKVLVHKNPPTWTIEVSTPHPWPEEVRAAVTKHIAAHFAPAIQVTFRLGIVTLAPSPPSLRSGTTGSVIEKDKGARAKENRRNGDIPSRCLPTKKIISIQDAKKQQKLSENICIEGEIFRREYKITRNEHPMLTLWLTDHHDSLLCKFFPRNGEKEVAWLNAEVGQWLRVQGKLQEDTYLKDRILMVRKGEAIPSRRMRHDEASQRRVELHAHTSMSAMDGAMEAEELIARAAAWGHSAVAITDHGGIQSFPDAVEAAKRHGITAILGMEAYLIDDELPVLKPPLCENSAWQETATKETSWVVLDVETTGLTARYDTLIELAAVRYQGGQIVDRFQSLINPARPLSQTVRELTGITDEMVGDAPPLQDVLPRFLEFLTPNDVLVAHNARFDTAFLQEAAQCCDYPPLSHAVLDTLELARRLLPQLAQYRLDMLTRHFQVPLTEHHRAIHDAEATAHVLGHLLRIAQQDRGITQLAPFNDNRILPVNIQKSRPFHATLWVQDRTGLRNLYELVTASHLQHFYHFPRIPKSLLTTFRAGLWVGSACAQGEVMEAALHRTLEEARTVAKFYDYLEIQPTETHGRLLKQAIVNEEQLHEIQQHIVEIGEALDKPILATGNAHYLDPEDAIFRDILVGTQNGFRDLPLSPAHFRTTEEMLCAFSHLGEETAHRVVIENPQAFSEQIETFPLFPEGTATPHIEGAEDELTERCYQQAHAWYGDPLPDLVQNRLETELQNIIRHGFAVIYLIAQRLVSKSLADGYLVGSRGSVGSSLVATLSGITEVNPLAPHWRCPQCQYSDFVTDGSYESGFDLPDRACPRCEQALQKDGQQIPFATFLGFDADKTPDIDLNFGSDYQPRAHAYAEELFGKDHIYRAGTIGRVQSRSAYGFVKKYEEQRGLQWGPAECERLVQGCSGSKRITGQHPGGLMVLPQGMDIHSFTPIQYPAGDRSTEVQTTHYDYRSISGKLLKLDLLGHQDPTTIRILQDMTGVNPHTIPLGHPKVLAIFRGTDALGITPEQLGGIKTGTIGIPEFGTPFVRQMLEDTQPTTFAELVRISGLSHGTDVWLGNTQELIREQVCTLSEAICTRDDIMLYLIRQGCTDSFAFHVMEQVRKGRGITEEEMETLRQHDIPAWYIKSCQKIRYMFPRAHAVAYVIMAVRIAWFKVHHPLAYYAAHFRRSLADFAWETISRDPAQLQRELNGLQTKGSKLSAKEKTHQALWESVLEFYARQFSFAPPDLYRSDAYNFILDDNRLIPPWWYSID